MAKKVIHITRSDGTSETIVQQKKHPFWAFVGMLIGLGILFHTWWVGAIVVGWLILCVVVAKSNQKKPVQGPKTQTPKVQEPKKSSWEDFK